SADWAAERVGARLTLKHCSSIRKIGGTLADAGGDVPVKRRSSCFTAAADELSRVMEAGLGAKPATFVAVIEIFRSGLVLSDNVVRTSSPVNIPSSRSAKPLCDKIGSTLSNASVASVATGTKSLLAALYVTLYSAIFRPADTNASLILSGFEESKSTMSPSSESVRFEI